MPEYDPNKTEKARSDEGYVGISLGELSQKSDAGLATWQSGWKPGTDNTYLPKRSGRGALQHVSYESSSDSRSG